MKYRLFSLLLASCLLSHMALHEGCRPQQRCPEDTSDLLIDTRGAPCASKCECNNQRFTGTCVEGVCQVELRKSCSNPGQFRPCQEAGCKGWQVCQPRSLFHPLWGDCRCDIDPETYWKPEPSPEAASDGGEGSSGFDKTPGERPKDGPSDRPPDRQEPTGEPGPEPPPADRCQDQERCGDGIDNDCDGTIDEGCAPCAPSRKLNTLQSHTQGLTHMAYSRNGKSLVSTGKDGVLLVREGDSGRLRLAIKAHGQSIQALALHPDQKGIATADAAGALKLWDRFTGQPLAAPFAPKGRGILALAYESTGRLAVSVAGDWGVELWQGSTQVGALKAGLKAEKTGVFCPTCDGSSRCYKGKCWEIDAAAGHVQDVTSLAFQPGSRVLATGSLDGTLRLWDVVGFKLLKTFQGHSSAITHIAFRSDGKVLASASSADKSALRLWDVATGQPLQTGALGHTQTIVAVAYHPSLDLLLSASQDQSLKLWQGPQLKLVRSFLGHTRSVTAAAFHPTAQVVASGADDGSIRAWDRSTGALTQRLQSHGATVVQAVLDAPRQRLATASRDKSAQIWDFASGQLKAVLEGHSQALTGVALRFDGRQIATSSKDGSVRLYDGASFQFLRQLQAYPGGLPVEGIAYHPQGQGFATLAHGAGGTRIWDAQGALLQTLTQSQRAAAERRQLRWSPDGSFLAVLAQDASRASFVELWDFRQAPARLYTLLANATGPLAFSPDSLSLVRGDATGIQLWDLLAQKAFPFATGAATAAAWGPRGVLLALAQSDGVGIWDRDRGVLLSRIPTPTPIQSLAFSADGAQLLAVDNSSAPAATIWSCPCPTPGPGGTCYGGPTRTIGRGPCQVGRWQCNASGTREACVGAIQPTPELPDGVDNDCDGIPDNGFLDLVVTTLSSTPTQASPGATLAVEICVRNQGHPQSRSGPLTARLYASTDRTITPSDAALTGISGAPADPVFSGLQGGRAPQCKSLSITLPANAAKGQLYLGAIADPTNQLPESDEQNNAKATPIDIQ